jgi:hypothetical protein
MEFYELVVFLEENPAEYTQFILTGKTDLNTKRIKNQHSSFSGLQHLSAYIPQAPVQIKNDLPVKGYHDIYKSN